MPGVGLIAHIRCTNGELCEDEEAMDIACKDVIMQCANKLYRCHRMKFAALRYQSISELPRIPSERHDPAPSKLPPCKGPKLRRFRDPVEKIRFKRLLSSPIETSSDSTVFTASSRSGGHGHVFEVEIDGESFALKIVSCIAIYEVTSLIVPKFKFFLIEEARRKYGPAYRRRVDDYEFTYHTDPFFAECRAYGKINEKRGSNGWQGRDFVVRCHGFIGLPAAIYEDILVDQFGITEWSRGQEDREVSKAKRQPFRALVKTLVDTPITIRKPARMLKDLKTLRSLNVFQRDVYARNYKDGLLVDFSLAWTKPHWHWNLLNTKTKERQLRIKQNRELSQFDKMIAQSGIRTNVRATRNEDFTRRLRSSGPAVGLEGG
ncbi:MAG: hypothetical protein Q9165_008313 [Trypethelium subeluteriae]